MFKAKAPFYLRPLINIPRWVMIIRLTLIVAVVSFCLYLCLGIELIVITDNINAGAWVCLGSFPLLFLWELYQLSAFRSKLNRKMNKEKTAKKVLLQGEFQEKREPIKQELLEKQRQLAKHHDIVSK